MAFFILRETARAGFWVFPKSCFLAEAWRNFRLIDEQLHYMLSVRVQIRFKPP